MSQILNRHQQPRAGKIPAPVDPEKKTKKPWQAWLSGWKSVDESSAGQ